MSDPASKIEIEVEHETSSDFRRIVVERIFGNVDYGGLKAAVYSQIPVYHEMLSSNKPHKKRIKRTVECELIMDPQTLIYTHEFLGEQIEKYKAMYGQILSPEEVRINRKKYDKSKHDDSQIGFE